MHFLAIFRNRICNFSQIVLYLAIFIWLENAPNPKSHNIESEDNVDHDVDQATYMISICILTFTSYVYPIAWTILQPSCDFALFLDLLLRFCILLLVKSTSSKVYCFLSSFFCFLFSADYLSCISFNILAMWQRFWIRLFHYLCGCKKWIQLHNTYIGISFLIYYLR